MDCNKTEVFLRELDRMCKETDCSNCRLCAEASCGAAYKSCNKDDYSTLFRTVQKWSDEHPQETILEHFQKILPDMTIFKTLDGKERIGCCPDLLDSRISHYCRYDLVYAKHPCGDCWNRPYEEAIRGNEE